MRGKINKMLNLNEPYPVTDASGGAAYSILKELHRHKNGIVILKTDEDALDMTENISSLASILKYPMPSVVFFPESDAILRIKAIKEIIAKKNVCLVTSLAALAKKTFSKESFNKCSADLKTGTTISRENLIALLAGCGYEKNDIVSDICEFSIRGEILDIWAADTDYPVRLVLNNDTIETIKNFDSVSQRSISETAGIRILPAAEKEETYILCYLDNGTYVFSEKEQVTFLPITEFGGDTELFKQKFRQWENENFQVFILSNNNAEKEHFIEILGEGYRDDIYIGTVSSGFVLRDEKLVFLTTNEIFSRYKLKIRQPKFKLGEPIESLTDIGEDSFVVHERYGIGIYRGLKKITAGGITAEYISIEYAKNDILFVPVNDFRLIQKYYSVGDIVPKINSLDNTGWKRTKEAAEENAHKIAGELLELYAERFNITRPRFVYDQHFEEEFEKEFIYEETSDQKKAIENIKNDMISPHPMDRCIFGDVGFGKTEVAMRAAFRTVLSGRQVCVLAPTTVLVQQHGHTFADRFADWPVIIETLTRFKPRDKQKKIIERLKEGKVDIIIGTHRLLSSDISFKNFGLLVIDEEHRFGVTAKEKLKMVKKNVDCLYLTATPIPRTLSMALTGIKDVSAIETPPAGRQQIDTMLLEYSEKKVISAIMYEISRGGQIFYIHNRIETIETCVSRLRELLPLVKFDYLHGRMEAKTIENKMIEFLDKKFDCLVSTTIVEAGLDIPNVNTIIIEEAENFGLGQLYQLRGRVGRSKIKAYCYLLFKEDNLTETGKKRLVAINEFSKLGSGFHLAVKDLQIRGAGEILGKKQHGYIDIVGFDMYSKMIEKYSDELKGLATEEELIPEISLQVNAFIPQEYISSEKLRIEFYKKIAIATGPGGVEKELEDRFGRIPAETKNLIEISMLRYAAKELGILKIDSSAKSVLIQFSGDTSIEPSHLLEKLKKQKFRFIKDNVLEIFFPELLEQEKNLEFVKNVLKSFK